MRAHYMKDPMYMFVLLLSFPLMAAPAKAQSGECVTAESEGCPPGSAFGTLQTTTSADFVAAVPNTPAGRYNTFSVIEGQQYEWSLCSDDGAIVVTSMNTQLTLRNAQNEHLCNSNDVCGGQAKLLWTATYTGEARVQMNQFFCDLSNFNNTMVWRCTTCGSIGMDELASNMAISVWPNPAANEIRMTFGSLEPGHVQYVVHDAFGREVLQGRFTNTGENALQLDISGLPAGQYLVRITMGDAYGSQFFVKRWM